MPRPSSDNLILGAILAVALALRVPVMFESLWFDEYYTSSHTIGTVALLLKSLYSDIHPPAYYTFMWAWTNVFGDSEASLRTPPLVCGIATITLVHHLGRSWFGSGTGRAAALILALAPVHIWYSTEARPYSAQLFLLTLTVAAFGKLQRGRTSHLGRWAAVYGIAIFTLAFTHYYMLAYAVAFSVLALASPMSKRRFVLTANVVTIALMGAYVGLKLLTSEFETGRGYLRAFGFGEAWRLFYDWFLCGYTLVTDRSMTPERPLTFEVGRQVALHGFQLLALIATVLGVRSVLQTKTQPPAWHVVAHTLWLPLFLLALTWLGKDSTYIERSALPALPFFAILLGAGIARCGARHLITIGIALLQLVTLFAFYAQRDVPTVYRPNPDWRGAAHYLGCEIDAHGEGLRVYSPYVSPDPLAYYDMRIQQARTFRSNDSSATRLRSAIEQHLGSDGFPGSWAADFAESMQDEFAASKEARRQAMQMTVYQWSRHEPLDSARPDRPFYVIYVGDHDHPQVVELLTNPHITEVDRRVLRWVRVHKMRVSE